MNHKALLYLTLMIIFAHVAKAQMTYEVPKEKQEDEVSKRRGDRLKGYRIRMDIGSDEQIPITDTITYGTHSYVAPERRSLGVAYAGNVNMPWQSKVFFDRPARMRDYIYLSGYQGMLYEPQNVLFYDTRNPFTFVHYRKGFSDDVMEEVLTGTLAFNLGRKLNIGVSGDYTGAAGFYDSNKSRNVDYRIFGSYRSDRYDLWAYIANDYYRQSEHGGIKDLTYISNPDQYGSGRVRIGSKDVPVNLPGYLLFNRIRSGHGFLSHRYKLGYWRPIAGATPETPSIPIPTVPLSQSMDRLSGDTIAQAPKEQEKKPELPREFIPVGSISHQIYYNKQSRRMIAPAHNDLWNTFYGEAVANIVTKTDINTGAETKAILPNDKTEFLSLHNTLSLSLIEGFRPWVKAGITGYVRMENYWAYNPTDRVDTQRLTADKFYSIYAGGELARSTGTALNFTLKGELGILGRDLGAFLVEGNASSKFRLFNNELGLKLDARLMNMRAPYYAEHHHGTWGWWDTELRFYRRLELGGRADLTPYCTWAELRTASLQNHLYWTSEGKPAQHSELIQMTMLRAGHRYRVGALGWDLEGAYQLSSAPGIVPVPALIIRADLHLAFTIAKVLEVQMGLEGHWHTSYYASSYHAPTQQFLNQSKIKIGGKTPLVNGYANFRHKSTRFYVRMFNAGESVLSPERLTMPGYVYNPMHLQAGVVVDLKN